MCILKNGKVLTWGSSKDGKMGLEYAQDRNFLTPKEIIALDEEDIYELSAGVFHSLAISREGEIFSFGNGKDGKLGYEAQMSLYPKKIEGKNFH